MNNKLLKDFCLFSRYQLKSYDIDPTYPVLKNYYELNKFDTEKSLWFTLLYVGFYHLGSAQEALKRYPEPAIVKNMTYPTGIERRGFRGNDLASLFVNSVLEKAKKQGLDKWISKNIIFGKPHKSWASIRQEFQTVRYAGPWASYKWADLLKNVHGYSISANDIGVGGNSQTAGPLPGMVLITGLDWKECALNVKAQRSLLNGCIDRGVSLRGLDQLETCLCDFNSLVKGHYYSGHDVDMQMDQLPKGEAWREARRMSIPKIVRGEYKSRWSGVRKELKILYKEKQIIYSDFVN